MQIKAMEKVVEKYSQAELWIVGDGKQRQALKHEVETRLIASVKFQVGKMT